jgi:hypothetical protein
MGGTVAVRERPIIFSAPMVRALLDGTKTQTRRVVNRVQTVGPVTEFGPSDTRGYDWTFRCPRMLLHDVTHEQLMKRCPFGQPGDRLWVRETHVITNANEVVYRADYPKNAEERGMENIPPESAVRWRPSIHMPRWASRITLEIVDVRVERVQDISNEDAIAEGCNGGPHVEGYGENNPADPYEEFAILWDTINGKRAPWDSNPWVWALTVKRIEP